MPLSTNISTTSVAVKIASLQIVRRLGHRTKPFKNFLRAGAILSALGVSGCASLESGSHIGNGQDKIAHMGLGIAAALLVTELTDEPFLGCLASIALGLAKEGYDSTGRGVVDSNDVYATMAGAGCVAAYTF